MSQFSATSVIPTAASSLLEWLNYWGSIHTSAIDLGLERVQPIAAWLGVLNPQAQVVTVAGTNGKGSTTTVLSAIYHAEGYKVALYQSPHIYRFNERIKINGVEVDDRTLINAFVQVEQARIACGLSLSFFEATTLAAFLVFQQAQCDVWVLEVGLGGRLDVVNLIDPDVAVITNIGLDHVEWLGDTIEKIAFEKAGIMRAGIPVVFGATDVPQAILTQAANLGCKLLLAGQDYNWQQYAGATGESVFEYASAASTLNLPKPELAPVNVAAAITAALALAAKLPVTTTAIAQAVEKAHIAGRFEVCVLNNRTVILDVAHNEHGVTFLLDQLAQFRADQSASMGHVHAVFSMLGDKDIKSVVSQLTKSVYSWHIASMSVLRAAPLQQLRDAVHGLNVHEYASVAQAFNAALASSQSQDIVLVCGSFHTLEAVWGLLHHGNE